MKISCQSCQAKYTIADEKVLGKIVKIRCKKCGATIVINGNEAQPQHPADEAVDTRVYDYTQQQSGDQWTVNVADGDQRTMGLQEIVSAFRGGTVNEETYIWRDGMSDWLPLREVNEVFSQCQMGARPSFPNLQSVPPPVAEPAMGALFGPATHNQDAPTEEVPAAQNGTGALFGDAQPSPAAARRQGGRGAGGADLFGSVAAAGGEDDGVSTSAAAASAGADKMTGARNENSVLFSLSALTSTATSQAPENKTTAQGDGSGLIDIRALSASMGVDSSRPKQAHVDDIMNLGGGGAFGAALAAPVLAPPPSELIDASGGGAQANKSKGLMFGLIGLGAFLFAGIIIAVLLLRGSGTSQTAGTGTGATATTPTAVATTSVAAVDTTSPAGTGTSGSAAGSDTSGTSAAKPVSTGGAAKPASTGATAAKPKDTPTAPGTAKPADTGAAIPTATATSGKPPSLADAMKASAGGGGDAPANTGASAAAGPFDRGAAAAALGSVNVASCKKPDGPTGTGHVTVTFAPGGNVTSAVVDSPPFAGTPVGGCVAGKFRGAHVPPFSGGNVTVGKSFSLN